MSVLEKIAFFQNRRDEVPNQELARALAESGESEGVLEIAAHLWDKNKNVQSDCLKVLYEIGYIRPELIAPCVDDFLKLLDSRNNRMVWGAMIALATIAELRPDEIGARVDTVIRTVENGSLISVVWGVKTLAALAGARPAYKEKVFAILLKQVQTCIPRDVPMHAENSLPALDGSNRAAFVEALNARQPELTGAQLARFKKVMKKLQA